MIDKIKNSLVNGKKQLWNFVFPKKICGRTASLAGLGDSALKIKLDSPKSYPHLDISGFISWDNYNDFTKEEKALVQALLDELSSS